MPKVSAKTSWGEHVPRPLADLRRARERVVQVVEAAVVEGDDGVAGRDRQRGVDH